MLTLSTMAPCTQPLMEGIVSRQWFNVRSNAALSLTLQDGVATLTP